MNPPYWFALSPRYMRVGLNLDLEPPNTIEAIQGTFRLAIRLLVATDKFTMSSPIGAGIDEVTKVPNRHSCTLRVVLCRLAV